MFLMSFDQSSKVSGIAVAEHREDIRPPQRDLWRLIRTHRISKASNSLNRRLDAIQSEVAVLLGTYRPGLVTVEEPLRFVKWSIKNEIALWRAIDRVVGTVNATGTPYAIITEKQWRHTCFRPPRPRSRDDCKRAAKAMAPLFFPNFDGGEDEAEATCQLYHVISNPRTYFK